MSALASLAKDPQYRSYLSSLENKYGLPTGILATQQQAESNFDPNAKSPAGAQGIAQFMPATAKQYGVDPMNPMQAADGQARMLRDLGSKYNGDIPSVLAAYNWGAGNLDNKGMANAPAETRGYIQKIMAGLPSQPDAVGTDAPGAIARFAGAVGNAIIPQAQAEEMPQDNPPNAFTPQPSPANDNPFAQMSDADLIAQAQQHGVEVPANDFAHLSDEQLLAEAQKQGIKPETPAPQQTLGRQAGLAARAVAEGVMSVPNIIGNAANAAINLGSMGVNAATGSKIPMMQYPGDITESALSKMGLPEPQTGIEKGVNFLSQIPTSVGSPGGSALMKMAPRIAEGTESALARVSQMMGKEGIAGKGEGTLPVVQTETRAPIALSKDQPLSQSLHDVAHQSYAKADEVGGTLTPQITNKFVTDATSAAPQTKAGKILFGDSPAAQLVERIKGLKDSPLSLAESQEIDEGLSDAMDGMVNKYGKLNKQGTKLLGVQSNFRNAILEAKPEDIVGGKEGFDAWKQGQRYWSQMMKARDVEKIMSRAEMMEVPATGIKTGFRTLLSKGKPRGWTDAEYKAAQQASKTGILTGILKIFGSRLIPIGATAAGAAVGHVPGAVASGLLTHAATTAARNAASKLQAGRATNVLKEIAKTANKGAK